MNEFITFLAALFLTPFGWIGMLCFGFMVAVIVSVFRT